MNEDNSSPDSASQSTLYPVEGRVFVLIAIAIVSVMFVGMVGLLYWRERPAASALLVIRVPVTRDGAIATVDTADARDLSPVVETLKGGEEIRIPLPPGDYLVKIEDPRRRMKSESIFKEKFSLTDYSYVPIIIEDHPATRPATRDSKRR
jgi:hypothetical protein